MVSCIALKHWKSRQDTGRPKKDPETGYMKVTSIILSKSQGLSILILGPLPSSNWRYKACRGKRVWLMRLMRMRRTILQFQKKEKNDDGTDAKKDGGGDFSNMYKRRKWRSHTGPMEGPGVTARTESIIQTSWAGRSSTKTYILVIIDYQLQKLFVEMISLEKTHSFFFRLLRSWRWVNTTCHHEF